MKKIIALAFSDLHINLWAKFNENNSRTRNHFQVLRILKRLGNKYEVPILFCGDFLHKPESIDQDLMLLLQNGLDKIFKDICPTFYCISGNHDMKHISTVDSPPYSWVTMLSRMYTKYLVCMDYKVLKLTENILVHGIPYVDHNIGLCYLFKDFNFNDGNKHILMLHTDYPGAEDTDGRKIDSVENINLNTLNKFDLVLCGHIHKPQRLSKKVYMLGAPLQQRRTDRDCKLGYWEVYDDLSLKFVPLDEFPRFIDVENEEDIKEDGNYYTVIPKKQNIQPINHHKINKQLSKRAIARKYLKTKGITDKDKKALLQKLLNQIEQ